MTNQQHPDQFDWATELLDAQGRVTLSAQEAHEIGARLRSMGDKLKAYEDLDEAASDVQLLRMGYAAAPVLTSATGGDWTQPTTVAQRLGDAMQLLCGGKRPPDELVSGWLDNTSEELQSFAASNGPAWAQGIGLIDAAMVMVNQPTEITTIDNPGRDHEHRAARAPADSVTAPAAGAVAGPTSDLHPEKCPITGRPFFMTLDHPELGRVPTYGGPYDSYTIPAPEGEPTDPWHERELRSERYDHDAGWWVEGGEPIPLRIVHEDVLFELQEDAEAAAAPTPPTQAADSQPAPVDGANWQDISTAPKDGTRFVAVGQNYGLDSETQHVCIAQWFRGCWMEVSDWNEASELKYLTHWMPLPPLPGSAGRARLEGKPCA